MKRGGDPGPSASIVATASSRWSQFEWFEAAASWFGGSGAPAEEVKPAAFSRGVGQRADARANPRGEVVLLALGVAQVATEPAAERGVPRRGHPEVPLAERHRGSWPLSSSGGTGTRSGSRQCCRAGCTSGGRSGRGDVTSWTPSGSVCRGQAPSCSEAFSACSTAENLRKMSLSFSDGLATPHTGDPERHVPHGAERGSVGGRSSLGVLRWP